MTVTVVVDMQNGFYSSSKCCAGVVNLIKTSMKKRSTIILVELDSWINGKTLPEISNIVKGYDKLLVVEKNCQDGSRQVQAALDKYKAAKIDTFRICGVNADLCVKDTAVSLANWYSNSKVILHFEATCPTSGRMYSTLTEAFNRDWYWFKHSTLPENLRLCKNNRIFNFKSKSKKAA